MPIALATSSRAVLGATLALFLGCGEQSIERRGGGEIPDLVAGSLSSAGSPSLAGAGAVAGQPPEAGAAGANEGGAAGTR